MRQPDSTSSALLNVFLPRIKRFASAARRARCAGSLVELYESSAIGSVPVTGARWVGSTR